MNWKNCSNQIALGVECEIAIAFDFAKFAFGGITVLDHAGPSRLATYLSEVLALVGKKRPRLVFSRSAFRLE